MLQEDKRKDETHMLVWEDSMALLNTVQEKAPLNGTAAAKAEFCDKYRDYIHSKYKKWPYVSNCT